MPHELNDVIAAHQKLLYKLQFRCVDIVLTQTAEGEYGCRSACRGCDASPYSVPGDGQLIGHEHEEDEIEIDDAAGAEFADCRCRRCAGEMKSSRSDCISAAVTRLMLQTVAAILLGLQRDGRSLLVQIQQALLRHPLVRRNLFTPYQIQLLESMLLECLDDPRPLLRSVLGRDHPLIRAAHEQAARPPPESVNA